MMHHIIYLSRTTVPMPESMLIALLEKARLFNQQHGITGALFYNQGQFVQLFEGEKAAVTTLYAKLLRDPRHTGLLKLADKAIAERSFASWEMAFYTTAPEQWQHVIGYKSPQELLFDALDLRLTDAHLLTLLKGIVLGTTEQDYINA